MPKIKYYTNAQIQATRKLFQDAAKQGPEKPDRYTRQQAFAQLDSELDELVRQGFSMAQIAHLASQGLCDAIGAPTLQKFLTPTKRRKRKKQKSASDAATQASSQNIARAQNVATSANSAKSADYLRERS